MVKHYRSLDALDSMDALSSMNPSGQQFCPECGNRMQRHGLLYGSDGTQYVCPGDYVVTGRDGTYYRLSRGEFEGIYEPYVRPPRFAPKTPSDLEELKQTRRPREGQ